MQSQALQVPHDGPTFCPESSFVFLHFIRQQRAILFFKFHSISSVTFLVLGLQKFSLKCITRLKTLLLSFLTSTPSPLSHPPIVSSSSILIPLFRFLLLNLLTSIWIIKTSALIYGAVCETVLAAEDINALVGNFICSHYRYPIVLHIPIDLYLHIKCI